MTTNGVIQILVLFGLVGVLAWPLGNYMGRVFAGEATALGSILAPFERRLYRVFGIDDEADMPWNSYALSLLTFSLVGVILSYLLLRLQGLLPMNPLHRGGSQMTPDLAFNASVSFLSNTNWQSYSPEQTTSHFSNVFALGTQNWMSAAAGIAVAVAVVRGFARKSARGIGNCWVDVTRAGVYVLLPLSFLVALVLVWQGVPQDGGAPVHARTVEGAAQVIAQGPIAAQEAIKMVGTNGGGLFNANSAHPYENPTPITNLVQILAMLLVPAAMTHMFGRMVGQPKQGWALFGAMGFLFLAGSVACTAAEQAGNPLMQQIQVASQASSGQSGGNMEGKETRFGISASTLFAAATTGASCGAVNASHDSFTPIGGLVPIFNIMTGEVIFGGVGSGLYGMLMFAVLAVFIAGLMVGRTPEYLGKKIEQREVKMAMLAVLVAAASVLGFTAVAANVGSAYGDVGNGGPHGFSEILYAYTSATGNNGSAMAGLNANTPFFNVTLGMAMLVGRFLMIIPLLAMAGSLAGKKRVPESAGTFPTDTATFAGLLVAVVIVVGALTFLPALALGPVVEHLRMMGGGVI